MEFRFAVHPLLSEFSVEIAAKTAVCFPFYLHVLCFATVLLRVTEIPKIKSKWETRMRPLRNLAVGL